MRGREIWEPGVSSKHLTKEGKSKNRFVSLEVVYGWGGSLRHLWKETSIAGPSTARCYDALGSIRNRESSNKTNVSFEVCSVFLCLYFLVVILTKSVSLGFLHSLVCFNWQTHYWKHQAKFSSPQTLYYIQTLCIQIVIHWQFGNWMWPVLFWKSDSEGNKPFLD